MLHEAQEARHIRNILEIQILIALTYSACQQTQEALQTLQAALTLARPSGYMRIFLNEGARLATLLRSVLAHTREKALLTYVQRILRTFAHDPASPNNTANP